MARAYQQSQPVDYDRDHSPAEWQSLRSELVALLDQVDGQVARSRDPSLSERMRDLRFQIAETEPETASRHRDALKSVQRQISRFEEPAPQMPPNPRDSLQAAINQIRTRQGEPLRQSNTAPAPAAPPQRALEGPMLERLAQAVTGLSGRLERLEGEIKSQVKTGANVKDVADQVAQLAHVVELLAGAVGETGQVKRLEGQIASLGKIMSQGREMDISTLTRRLDDVASTVGKLAELQVHYADRVQNPVESEAFKDGMRSIESSVRNVYDRIDALERNSSLTPSDLEHVTSEMARFTEAMRSNSQTPHNLVELVDALNSRISDIESGDRLLHGLRKDLGALRDAIIVSLTPRFDAIDQRLETLSGQVTTRDDMAEIGRQIGMLSDRIGERPIDPGIGQLEAQVRQLVARMDQTGEQLSGLATLYSSEPTSSVMPAFDYDAMAEMVASRAADALSRTAPGTSINDTLSGLESRISTMLQSMRQDTDSSDFGGMQAGINEVNERLRRLETSLLTRTAGIEPAADMVRKSDIEAIIAEADVQMPPLVRPRVDSMPRSPAAEAPLNAPAFPAPAADIARGMPRMRHPGLDEDVSLAARHDAKPVAPAPAGFDPAAITVPPAPTPSAGFFGADPGTGAASVSDAAPTAASSKSTNTFIEAARRAAQRQPTPLPEAQSNSLIGRALSRFQTTGDKPEKAEKPKPTAKTPKAPRALAGDKPARTEFKPEPVVEAAPAPTVDATDNVPKADVTESFLSRNRKAILLGAAVLAIGLMTLNLVAQRMMGEAPAPAAAAPITTGDIDSENLLPSDVTSPTETAMAQTPTPRVIDMVDPTSTGSIDRTAAQGFTTAPLTAMPSAFGAATDLANASPVDALVPSTSPIKVDLPPEAIGPIELRQAAADGDARAQFEVAAIFTEGRAVPQDYKAAAIWYERSAAQGFAPAQYRLGSLYENGNGVDKDLDTAKLWYERAAEAGNRMSMHNLAALYAGGQLGKQQFDSAAKWFEEAANRGMTDSQFNLGMLYARGLGVPQSLEDSFKWFGIAARSGDKDAAKARDDMARSIDADTMTRLTDLVNNFKAAPIDLAANFAPIGSWSKAFDPGETIATRDIVASVQKALVKLGYDIGTPDGIAGAKTAAAIKSFEQATGMSEIGLINPRLLAVLGSQPV